MEVDGDTVVFGQGIEYSTPYLHLYGTDSAGRLYRIRKSWGEVGANKPNPNRQYRTQRAARLGVLRRVGLLLRRRRDCPIQAGLTSDGPVVSRCIATPP